MKKYLLILMTLMFSVSSGYAFDKYSIDRADLPAEAREFLELHFPKSKIAMIKVDKHLLKKTDYDVKLVNGTKVEFNNSGKWTSVDCKRSAVPEKIVPDAIKRYVKKNCPDVKIVRIEKTATQFEVELSDDVELTFNHLGQFKSMKMKD